MSGHLYSSGHNPVQKRILCCFMDHQGQLVANLTVQGQGFLISVGGGPADGQGMGYSVQAAPGIREDDGVAWCMKNRLEKEIRRKKLKAKAARQASVNSDPMRYRL